MKSMQLLPRVPILAAALAYLLAGHVILLSPALGYVADPEKDLPYLDRLEIFQPGEPSILYSNRDEPIAALASEYRIFVPLQGFPSWFSRPSWMPRTRSFTGMGPSA